MNDLQIIGELEAVTEIQARTIRILATRLAELDGVEACRDEIERAERAYRKIVGENEGPG